MPIEDKSRMMRVKLVMLLLIAVLSVSVVSKVASSPEHHRESLNKLDKKKAVVMELSAAAAATSAAITVLADDIGTPVAEEIADLSFYFLLITCAIFLEKYLLTLSGYLAFCWFIPVGCLMIGVAPYRRNPALKTFGIKLITFALALYMTVPISLFISDKIEETYNVSIQETIVSAKETMERIEDESAEEEVEEKNWFSKVVDGVTSLPGKIQNTLNNFIESIAVLIVTSCVFPILTFACCMWITQLIWGVELGIPGRGHKRPEGHLQKISEE